MLNLKIISPGMMTTIQDAGRYGYRHFGIPESGYMDGTSADLANLLVGNELGSPLIECTYQGCTIAFEQSCVIALTGADLNWKLDANRIKLNTKIGIEPGQILKGGYAASGMRAYLAVKGNLINGLSTMGSLSTYLYAGFGGLNGQALKKGDVIKYETSESRYPEISLETNQIILGAKSVRITLGPEFGLLSKLEQGRLFSLTYKIGSDLNRMGARLEHEAITQNAIQLENSKPTCPGMIQLLPSGQLVVLLQDGQTTGGYPRIAYLDRDALYRFNQIKIGNSFKFVRQN